MTDTTTLAALLARVAAADRAAFHLLYQATSRKLYGVVLRIMKRESLTEEILQEVYLRIWNKAETFEAGKATPMTWMITIARNRALDEVRKRTPEADDNSELESIADTNASTPHRRAEVSQALGRLQGCIDTVGGQQAEMVKLAYLDGFSREALSARFSQPVGTIKVWLHRSLKQIRSCMAEVLA
ncbi:sigma-70 family RNA polymerase sigma factor [Allohahella sp. A8]|uniref:sigma-70 family RNA polymerase sigma factor n=1 Tax=Allohahella sp. A8 TaxID=3141461 RepID=UPI000C091BCD|nr:RNA polymerase subunit sigma-24 [Hahellaceae bacterium]|tara:strand:+ start:42602 stop:43156 length:555 start_codon:yes stop_codon:yes gene_type:complete